MLYEKFHYHNKMGSLYEIPYGFKNLWVIDVSYFDIGSSTFLASSVVSVQLNGQDVTEAQLRQQFDYNRDGASLTSPTTSTGIYITLTSYDHETSTYNYRAIIEQELTFDGVLGISGDMVDNTNPQRPVINHDTQKLDVSQYTTDTTALNTRLTTDETNIGNNTASITALQGSAITAINVNGESVPVTSNTADITLDFATTADLNAALANKVDTTIAGVGETIVQSVSDNFDTNTGLLNFNKTMLSLETGDKTTASTSYDLATLLGITSLEARGNQLFYFVRGNLVSRYNGDVTFNVGDLFSISADGTRVPLTDLSGVQVIFALRNHYIDYNVVGWEYIEGIGRLSSSTATTITASFIPLGKFSTYNPYNAYYVDQAVLDPSDASIYVVIQDVPRPTTASQLIPLTNTLYYTPVRDDSIMASDTVWANVGTGEGIGVDYPLEDFRLRLLEYGSGYTDFVRFTGTTIPAQIINDSDWDSNVSLWVTDGLSFTSFSGLLAYLSNFQSTDRYKLSNLGGIATHYENGGIVITPFFNEDTIKNLLADTFQPIPTGLLSNQIPVYNSSNVLISSGRLISDIPTLEQGAKADTAVQEVSIAPGPSNGSVTLTVDGSETNVTVTGLGSAAYTDSTSYATSSDGVLAQSALQSVSLSPGASNGTINITANGTTQADIAVTGLASAAYSPITAFATSAQGALADTSIQSVSISSGTNNGTIQYNTNGGTATEVTVTGINTAAYQPSTAFVPASQNTLINSALQPANVVDNLTSTSISNPLSANQGRILNQKVEANTATGRPIGGFATYADVYTLESQYSSTLTPINVGDRIYVASDENYGNVPTEYRVSAKDGSGNLTYSFLRITPNTERDFFLNPIQPGELADGAVNTNHIQNLAIATADIADNAITTQKLATDLQTTLNRADNALLFPITTSGTGNFINSISQNTNGTINAQYANAISNVSVSGTGDCIDSASISGNTLSLSRNSTAIKTVNVSGSGNFLSSVTSTPNSVSFVRGNAIAAISTTGNGNVIASISNAGIATRGTAVTAVTKSGTGNVITGVSTSGNAVTLSSGNAVTALVKAGTGTTVNNLTLSGGTLTATMGATPLSVPDASTSIAGIVQLNDTATSTSTQQAATANQIKVLNDKVNSNDSLYVKLQGNQSISGTKTIESHLITPAKSTIPATPLTTQYATEAQVATRIPKPSAAVQNNIAVFDNNMNVVDGGRSYSSFEPVVPNGNTTQYYRGDKTWQTLNAAAAGAVSTTAPIKTTPVAADTVYITNSQSANTPARATITSLAGALTGVTSAKALTPGATINSVNFTGASNINIWLPRASSAADSSANKWSRLASYSSASGTALLDLLVIYPNELNSTSSDNKGTGILHIAVGPGQDPVFEWRFLSKINPDNFVISRYNVGTTYTFEFWVNCPANNTNVTIYSLAVSTWTLYTSPAKQPAIPIDNNRTNFTSLYPVNSVLTAPVNDNSNTVASTEFVTRANMLSVPKDSNLGGTALTRVLHDVFSYVNTATGQVGALVINFPTATDIYPVTGATGIVFKIRIRTNANTICELSVGTNCTNSANPFSSNKFAYFNELYPATGTNGGKVRLFKNATNCGIILGDIDTTFNNVSLFVTDMYLSSSTAARVNSFKTAGWSVAMATNLTGYTFYS